MFKNLFNIGTPTITQPILVEPAPPVRIRKPKKAVVKPSLKEDAQNVLDRLLDDLQNVNNPKVDVLRMLAISLENGDYSGLKAFCKEPIKPKKKIKKSAAKF